ncbi:MAG: nucleotidyltransferase family protein [Rhodopseudomonas palustris]|nr:nucleotidyltransferase family protein [Rhodopseudomonas palustris]
MMSIFWYRKMMSKRLCTFLKNGDGRANMAAHLANRPGISILSICRGPDGYELDIHWRVFYQCPWDGADLTIWKQAEMVAFKGINIRILSPAQQILHNCSHGIRWNALSSIRWIVDVLKIMEKGQTPSTGNCWSQKRPSENSL